MLLHSSCWVTEYAASRCQGDRVMYAVFVPAPGCCKPFRLSCVAMHVDMLVMQPTVYLSAGRHMLTELLVDTCIPNDTHMMLIGCRCQASLLLVSCDLRLETLQS